MGIEVCSPTGLVPEQWASVCCHEGMVKYGQTSEIPWTVPVLSKMAKTPSVPAAGMTATGGLAVPGG